MINCPHCKHENPSGSRFCSNCGKSFPFVCPNCGHENAADANFCNFCGHKLNYAESSVTGDDPHTSSSGHSVSPTSLASPQQLVNAFESTRQTTGQSAERRIVTILFCDIEGSTAAASRFDPEDWTEIINSVFERMIRPIYHYEGTVARLMGDGLLAFFGAPHAHEDDPQRAVLAGLDIITNMQDYREEIRQRWDIDLNLRVGINTGLVTVGEVGSGLRAEYSALGDAINLAARMEQTAVPGTVQIADPTYRLIAGRFEIEPLGQIQVKGKEEPITAYRVLGQADRTGLVRSEDRLKAMLIGREEEMAVLDKTLTGLKSGLGRVICLIGEAGLGKSRLVEELHGRWLEDAPDLDHETTGNHWLACYGISYEMSRPYGLIQQLIRRILGITAEEGQVLARERLAAFSAELTDQDGSRLYAALDLLLGFEPQGPGPILEGESLKRAIFEALSWLVEAWHGGQPAVLVFDDLHWADSASVELINHLVRLANQSPILFLCLFRPERQAPSWSIKTVLETNMAQHYDEIVLQPLAKFDSGRLVAWLLDDSEISPAFHETVAAKSEGNPFYIQEVVRTIHEMGGSDQWQGMPHLPGASIAYDELPIPETIQALLTARIDRLDDDSRHVLQLAAVIGRRFIISVLQHIYEQPRLLGDQIRKLEQADIISEIARIPDREYQFSQALFQEAAYRTILRRDRRIFHQRVAEIIEQQFPNRLEEFATQLAYHFSAARDLRAAAYHKLAGDIAYRLHANAEAAEHYGQALKLLRADPTAGREQLAHLFTRLGRALELVDRYAEALANYEDMERTAEERDEPSMILDALVRQGLIRSTVNSQFDQQQALALADRSLSLAQELGDQEMEARIHWNLLNIARFGGLNLARGIKHGEQALAIAVELNHRELQAYLLNDLADSIGGAGQSDDAQRMLVEAMAIWQDLDNQPMMADSLNTAGTWDVFSGSYELALQRFEKAFAISKQIHNLWGQAYSRSFVGLVFRDLGRPGEVIRIGSEGSRLSDQIGFIVGRIMSRALQGAVYSDLGAVDQGFKLAAEAYALAESLLPPFRPLYAGYLADLYLQKGDIEAAGALIEEVRGLDRIHEVYIRCTLDLVLGKLMLARKLPEQALIQAGEGIAWLRQRGIKASLPDFLRLQAEVLLALGREGEALSSLQEGQNIAREIGNLRSLWPIMALRLHYFGFASDKSGHATNSESELLLDQARQAILAIAAETPEYDPQSGLDLRSLFLNQQAVRELITAA